MKKVFITGAVMIGIIAVLFGWLPRDRTWQAGTGWDGLAAAHLPPGGVSQELFFDDRGGPAIQWLGHSGFMIEWAGQSILLDPNFQGRVTLSRRYIDAPEIPAGKTFDLVCISHAHFDHMSLTTLAGLDRIGKIFVPEGSEVYLPDRLPGRPVIEGLDEWESTNVGALTITAVPAKHNGCRYHPWRSRYKAVGYVISDGSNSVYFAGDTAYQSNVFTKISEMFSPDTAILPIGSYAPRFPFKIHHMDPGEAAQAGSALGVSHVIPCHFGTYRLTLDPPSQALPRFAEEASRQHLFWSMPKYCE